MTAPGIAASLTTWLDRSLGTRSRITVVLLTLLLAASFAAPMWHIKMWATQFPDGLELRMYPHRLSGGNDGRDINEINTLNHYIGMRPLEQQNFVEMRWIPFALGVFGLLALRTAVFGKVGNALDLLVLFTYFGAFSLGTFYYRLWDYGHTLSPDAPIKVPPFTPPIVGHQQLANFEVYSYPGIGSLLFVAFGAILAGILLGDWFAWRRAPAAPRG
jgi:hypothetical protein